MKLVLRSSKLLTFCFLLFSISIHAQTDTLINPSKEGGFELGNGSFAANGWSVSTNNATQVNQWTASWGAQTGFQGIYCAYITDQPTGMPPRHQFTPFQNSTVHFYRDVTFPAGKTQMYMAFSCLNPNYQAPVRVALVHRDSALTTGITLGTYGGFNSFFYFGVSLDMAVVGNCYRDSTWRLVFSWTEPSNGTTYQPSPAIDNVFLYAHAPSTLLSGTDSVFTIDKTRPTTGTNFKSIKDVIGVLNEYRFLCIPPRKLIFNVAAGQIFEDLNPSLTISGRENAPIIFQKSGVGANPVVKPKITDYYNSAGLFIYGGDYLTFDGIDINGRNDSSTYTMTAGYVLQNGAQNNTIKNCTITLDNRARNNSSNSSSGITQKNNSSASKHEETNSKNRFLNVNIHNAHIGINILSNSNVPDSDIEIGSTDPQKFMDIDIPEGDEIASTAIYTEGVNNLNVHHIRANTPFIIRYGSGQNRVYNNKIAVLNGNYVIDMYVSGGTTTYDMYNNFLSLPRSTFRNKTTTEEMAVVRARIYGEMTTFNFYNNSLLLDATLSKAYSSYTSCLSFQSNGTVNLLNNIFVNASQESSRNKTQYCLNGTLNSYSQSDYNAFWRVPSITKIGIQSNVNILSQTLTDWQNAHGSTVQDAHSVETDPFFLTQRDLHTYSSGIDGKGTTPPNGLLFDIDNEQRTSPFDIGADQFTRQPIDLAILDLLEPNDSTLILCENSVRKVKVLVKNVGTQTLNFAQNALTAKVILSKPVGKDTFLTTISADTLAIDSTKIVELNTFTSSDVGVYTFETSIATVGDTNRQNDSTVYERRLLASKPLPFIEGFDNTQAFSDWTLSSTVSLQYRGKTGYSLSLSIPSVTQPTPEFKLPKIGKIDTASLFNFDYRIVTSTYPNNLVVPNTPNWGKIEILGSTDCGVTFTKIKTIDTTNHRASTNFQSVQLPLSTFAGKELVLKFVIISPLVNQIYVDFDNFYIGPPCRGLVGMDSIPAPTALNCVGAQTSLIAKLASPNFFGTKFEWQFALDTTQTWQKSPSPYIQTKEEAIIARGYPIFYRLKTTCETDGSSRLSNVVLVKPTNLPTIAQVPFKENFESWQSSPCIPSFVSNDVPTNSWVNKTTYGDVSWRRNDAGNTGNWNSYTYGTYTPSASSGQYSARLHTTVLGNSYNRGTLDLHIDLSSAQEKQLAFDYLNTDGPETLQVSLSADGGVTFQPIDTPLSIATTWRRSKYTLPANGSAKSVLRFEGIPALNGNYTTNTSDIGLDSLTIENITTAPICITLTLPQNGTNNAQDDQLLTWQSADYAAGYRIKIGTTANGSDVLPLTDVGNIRQYRAPIFYDYQKTYYATLEPYNNIGTAQGCPVTSFTIGKNSNFGGGRNGLDSLQPLSGGYKFANSSLAATNAPIGKAVYNWIDPQSHSKVSSFTSSNSTTVDGYYYLNSRAKFFCYNSSSYSNTIILGSNGIMSFGANISSYFSNKTIPSSDNPYDGIIAPCHTPLYRGSDSRLYFQDDTTQFVATWWHFYASNGGVQDTSEYITFQVILKTDGSIKFQYNADESSVGRLSNSQMLKTALVGIEGYSQNYPYGQHGIQYRNKGRGARIFDAQNKSLAIDFQAPKGDLRPLALMQPQDYIYCLQDIKPKVLIQNTSVGTMNFAETPATVELKITSPRTKNLTFKIDTGTLAGGQSREYTFTSPLSMDTAGYYYFDIIVKNSLDENPTNDTLRASRSVQGKAANLPYLDNFNTNGQYGNDGNDKGFNRNYGGNIFQSPSVRLRKGDFLAFDYRLLSVYNFQPANLLTSNDWDKMQIRYTTDCGYNFTVLDSITPSSHSSTFYWRQKALSIPDSLAGKFVTFQILFFNRLSYAVMDIDNFYIGRACDSTQIDIGNITAPPSVCQGDKVRAGVFERPIAPFMQYNWQYSTNNGTSWANVATAEGNNYLFSQANLTATYRVIGTCTLNQISDTTNTKLITTFTPEYAPLPYAQGFENWQTSSCNNTSYTNDLPDAYWLNLSQSSNSPWRRNDQGNLGGWSNASGAYTPTSSQGSFSARFNSTVPYPPVQASLNLFVNLSGTTDKTLAFDYLNKNGSDSLRVSWSTDGGATFTPLSNLNLASSWTQYSYSLTGGTAQSVIRFEGINQYEQYGRDDIGLDNVRVFANNFSNDAAISAISPRDFGCQNTTQPLTVKLRNAGISAINLATTPITVNVTVSGAQSNSFTKTVNTGSLAVGELLNIVVQPNFVLSAAGIYNIDASLISTADSNTVNNILKTQVRVVSETTIPYAETFDNSPNFPIGWLTEGGVRMDTSWRNNGNFRLGFYMTSYFDPNLSTKGGSFTMPKIGVVRANDYLSFDALIARYNEPLPSGVDWGNVEAILSDDCGQTWTTIWTANSTNFNSSLTAANIRIPLSNYVGKSIIVRLTSVYKTDNYFVWFDNFKVNTKCIGAPTITAITGSSSICYGEKATLQTAVGTGIGLNWVWQKQDTTVWTAIDTNKTQITTSALFSTKNYRVVATCLIDSTTATSVPFSISVNPPVYAQLPYYQDFEAWQSCGNSNAQALPDASWVQQNYTGNASWRRNDNGANAAWTSPTAGIFTPLSTKGSFSARFHTSQTDYYTPNYLDVYLNLSQTIGVKYLSFDYNNSSSANSISLYYSKDGGKTFNNITTLSQTTKGWERFESPIYSDSAKTVIRFVTHGYPYSTIPVDMGMDNLIVSNKPMPNCVSIISPSSYSSNVFSDAVVRWQSSAGAKGYKIKIGTTQNGSEFVPLTDIGRDTFFKPVSKFAFLTTYFVSVFAYDSLDNARTSCYPTQFTIQRNPNFGGGANGNDPNQPMSGGYYFANSTFAAAAALPSQPSYKWIDPLSNNHTTIATWTTGNSNNGSFTLPNIGFDFSFFGTIYRNNIFVNSNGALHFGAANSSTGADEYIPRSFTPNNFLAACWMDLAAGTDGKVYYGTAPTGEYVVTWWHYHDVEPNATTIDTAEYITFQAILNPNGTIKVQFNDTESTANNGRVFDILNDALIGIEDASGTMGIQYRNNGGPAPMFSSPLAVAFALNNKLLPVQNPLNTEGVSVGNAFPNPSSNQFTFDFYTPQKMLLNIQLSNSLGQAIWKNKAQSQIGWQQKTVDWNDLPAGIYWLTVATEQGQRFMQRVVRN